MSDAAWALQQAREVGPIAPPKAQAQPIKKLHTGPLHSSVAGRTDHLPSNVPNGSYVLPADIVSGLGEGNTMAGFKAAKKMFEGANLRFGGAPYSGNNGPYGQSGGPYGFAAGGSVDGAGGMAGQITHLPQPESFNIPEAPTPEHMAQFGRVENVPLSQTRATQTKMGGESPGDLIKGYGDRPVAVRKRNGEHLIYDGHHRTIAAINKGHTHMPMHVIDAHHYAPHAAGYAPAKPTQSDDDLLKELGMARGGRADHVPVAVAGGEHVVAPHEVAWAGMGNMDAGHKALDAFVLRQRQMLIKTLKGLRGPKRGDE